MLGPSGIEFYSKIILVQLKFDGQREEKKCFSIDKKYYKCWLMVFVFCV